MRDKYLTEAMGYRNVFINDRGVIFATPKDEEDNTRQCVGKIGSWDLFGLRWEWAQKQVWWGPFHHSGNVSIKRYDVIHPDRLADALYTYLKERDDEV